MALSFRTRANPQQLQAIQTTKGPVLIIAGPGSGKTFTLVERIVHLIKEGADPTSLFVVTFTDKAARELTTRISSRLSDLGIKFNLNEMYLGTFHSVCLRILEDFREFTRLRRSFTVFDQFDQQYFLYQKINEFRALPDAQLVMGEDQRGRWAQSEELLRWLNKVSEEALDIDGLARAKEPEVRALAACFGRYQELLDENNSLDFSGIQLEAMRLLERHLNVLKQLRENLSYLMVDEYQDTNTIQERILVLLAGKSGNLCVVGDDDQGLYRFRGATIRNILEFPNLFKKGTCRRVTLSTNYRSHPDIIRFYSEWMDEQDWTDGGQTFRFEKSITPRKAAFPKTPTVLRLAAADEPAENIKWHAVVLRFLNKLKKSKKLEDWNQVAFLFRSVRNDRVVALARFLESQGVPVYSPRSNMFFERDEVRLMIGALIFLFPNFQGSGSGQRGSICQSGITTTISASARSPTSCGNQRISACSIGRALWRSDTSRWLRTPTTLSLACSINCSSFLCSPDILRRWRSMAWIRDGRHAISERFPSCSPNSNTSISSIF